MVVKKKRQRFPKPSTCIAEFLHVTVRYPRPGWRILTPLPIKIRTKACVCGTLLSFRIDKPMSNCCSHETLLHFGLQKLSFEFCYYHQDLHQELFYSGLRQELHSKPHALLLIAASWNNNDWVSVTRLSAIHFRAGPFGRWVVTHSLVDFNFHNHHPAVKMNQHPLWYLMSEHLSTITQCEVHSSSPVLLTKNGARGVTTCPRGSPK